MIELAAAAEHFTGPDVVVFAVPWLFLAFVLWLDHRR